MKKILLIAAMAALFFAGYGQSTKMSLNRDSIPEQYKWDLSHIYPGYEAWEADLKTVQVKMDEIIAMKGQLSKSVENLSKTLKLQQELSITATKLYVYPYLQRHANSVDQEATSHLQQVQYVFAKFGVATAWITPEMLTIPQDTMMKWIGSSDFLKTYTFTMTNLYRQQSHVLSEDKEALLSYFSQFNNGPQNIYEELSISDIVYPEITLSTGEKMTLTPGNYSRLLSESKVQADRKNAFEAYYQVYKNNINTYGAIYKTICQGDWASAQARNYSSCLDAALNGNNIPQDVYLNLIKSASSNNAPLRRYMELRKKVLGLTEQNSYDASIPLIDYQKNYPYDEAKKHIKDAVVMLGLDYQKKIETALENRWVDVYENKGKTSGAFSLRVNGVHPYMLMNYNETMDNMFTLIHELGHTCHSLLANETQPYPTVNYTIFVAEVASTFNEAMLLDHLLQTSKDPKEKIVLLTQAIENIVGTFYSQAMFADFELQAHQMIEAGTPVSAEVFNGIMEKLTKDYYGETMVYDDLLSIKWARISHFFTQQFYVYQYATCYASSAQIYKQINATKGKKEKQAATDKYLTLLKSGGNDHPMEQLKKAGVDLTQPDAFNAVVEQLDSYLTLLEAELAKLKQ